MDYQAIIEKIKQYWKIIVVSGLALAAAGVFFLTRHPAKQQNTQDLTTLTKSSISSKSSSSGEKKTTAAKDKKSDKVTVDVKGAVKNAGIYTLADGARVNEAIRMAGGFTSDANQKSVNLAEKLKDEQVIYVANNSEQVALPGSSAAANSASGSTSAGASGSSNAEKVNINTADLTQLQTLSGIGAKKAQDIIDYRTQNGSFKSIEDLGKVSGFGDKTVERLKDSITVD